MHTSSDDDVRFVVIRSLQRRLARQEQRAPGSPSALAIERAIAYALSDRRTQDQPVFLEHDVLRNARSAIGRRMQAEERARARSNAVIDLTTPENRAVALDLEDRLRRAVRVELGPRGLVVLDSMLDEDTVEETAVRLHISARTVNRLRHAIRAVAAVVLALLGLAA